VLGVLGGESIVVRSDEWFITDYGTVRYDVTMEDPEVFTKAWHAQETFRLRPNERILEYECIENNEDLVRFEKLLQNEPVFRKP
jgi:hypothetical protein